MKKHFGKITLAFVLSLLFVSVCLWTFVIHADAATVASHSFIFHGSYTYPYVVLLDKMTGNIVDASTGVPAAAETWEANDIAATQHAESDFWVATIPALSTAYEYLIVIADAASAGAGVETDALEYIGGYSPEAKCVIDDGMPYWRGSILVK